MPGGYWPDTDHGASWSTTDYLLANLIDSVRELTWAMITVNLPKGKHLDKPEPHYRPGARKPAQPVKKQSWGEFVQALAAMDKQADRRRSAQSGQTQELTGA